MNKTKASIVTMIKAASSRAILLIFSSFLPAWAVRVVNHCNAPIGFYYDVCVSVSCHSVCFIFSAPRQRQGKQSEEGYFDFSFHISCFCGGLYLQFKLRLSVLYALLGNVVILLHQLNSDTSASRVDASNHRRTTSHRAIKDAIALVGVGFNQILQ